MTVLLPFELHELIIDHLRFSFPELKVCSLVCKSWLPRCRKHLFRVVRIGPRSRVDPNLYEHGQPTFFSLLPDTLSCVRGLRLSYPFGPGYSSTSVYVAAHSRLIVSSLAPSAFPFKHLRLLHVNWRHHCGIGGITAFDIMLQQIDCLEHLIIEGHWNFNIREDILRSVAVHAPNLKTLCLSKLQWFPLFNPPIIDDMLSRWNARFCEKCIPPLRLQRLCLKNLVKNSADLVKVVVLPSPCLDLSDLRYLAMPASSLLGALDKGRFPYLCTEVTHLAIINVDTPAFRLHAHSFPKISHLQLFIREDWILLQFLQNIREDVTCISRLIHLHMNFGSNSREQLADSNSNFSDDLLKQHSDVLSDAGDLILLELIQQTSMRVSMHFAQADSSDTHRKCIQKVFPRSFATGRLDWVDRKSLEWWSDYE